MLVLYGCLLTTALAYDTSAWKCFDEEPVVAKYADSGNPIDLPHYRTLVGDWGSWILTNWIARILLKEKMGVDLDWWCTDDWTKYSTCDLDYPVSTWDNVEKGVIDMNLEAWVRAGSIAGHLERTYEDKVADFGPVGTTGEAMLYTADYDGTWTLGNYKALKDVTIRNTIFADMKPVFDHFKGMGWLKTYTSWEAPGVFAAGKKADTLATSSTVITKPYILAVGYGWAHTRLIWDKMNNMGIAQYYDLWVTDSEPHLSNIVDYAGARKKHFVAQLFSPGYDMASFQKQRVAWPVPKESGCSTAATCEALGEPLYKVVNPRTINKIPEVKTFIERLRIPGNQPMNGIMYDQLFNNILWEQAACNWLKANEDVWSVFITPIVRYEITEAWYVIYIKIGCVLLAACTIAAMAFMVYKFMKPSAQSKNNVSDEIRNEAKGDLMNIAYLIFMDFIDILSTCWATSTCFVVAGDNHFLVACFCILLLEEFVFNLAISFKRFQLIKIAMEYLRTGKMKLSGTDGEAIRASYMDRKLETRGSIVPRKSMGSKKRDFALNYELLTLCAGMGQDFPNVLVYIYMFYLGYLETSFIVGTMMSVYALGWKMSSLEKFMLHKRLHKALAKAKVGESGSAKKVDGEDKST